MDTIEDSLSRDPGNRFNAVMYADFEIMGRRSCPQEAKGRADRPPTLGDASRNNRRRRRGGRGKKNEGGTERQAIFARERPVLDVRAQQMMLQNLRVLPARQGGDKYTTKSNAGPRPAPTARHALHALAPDGRSQGRRQDWMEQSASSHGQGQHAALPTAHAVQNDQTAPAWGDEGYVTTVPQEHIDWDPAIVDSKNNKAGPVVAIMATCTASQEEAQRPITILTSQSSQGVISSTQDVSEMALEEDEQTDRKDETEAACPCKAEPEMLLTESLSAHHEAAQRPLAIITAPSSEDASSPAQAVPVMAPEEDAQTDVEEETKAASLCAAEHKEPLTMEQRDQGICQLLLQAQPAPTIVDSPENMEIVLGASQALSETSLEEGEQTDIEDEDEAQAEASSLCAAEPERSRAAEQRDQGALVIYQAPMQGISSGKVAAPGTLPLPYLGEVIIISRNLMLFVDAVLLCGCRITAARPQQLLTCPAPAPTQASAAAPGPAQDTEPTFSRLADAMDAAWYGQVASVPSAKLECHAEAAAACAPPSPQNQQGACKEKRRGGFMGFLKALLLPCLGQGLRRSS